MNFEILSGFPVNIQVKKEIPNELSSVEGVSSKYLYIAKINQFSLEVERPTVKIFSDKYIHLK
mgnify:CR=1 FL=1